MSMPNYNLPARIMRIQHLMSSNDILIVENVLRSRIPLALLDFLHNLLQ